MKLTKYLFFIVCFCGVLAGVLYFYNQYCLKNDGAGLSLNIKQIKSYNDIPVWFLEDENSPVISITLVFDGGFATDLDKKEGLTELSMSALTSGGSAEQNLLLKQSLEDISANFGVNVSIDKTTINITALLEDIYDILPIINKIITKPNVTEAGISTLKLQTYAVISAKQRNPNDKAFKELFNTAFNSNIWHSQFGTNDSVKSITVDDIKQHIKNSIALDNVSIGVVGNVDKTKIDDILNILLKDIPNNSNLTQPKMLEWSNNTGDIKEVNVDFKGLEQAVIMFAFKAPDVFSDDFYSATLINNALGGGSGLDSILATELREKRGFVYGAYTSIINTKYGNIWIGSTMTSHKNIDDTKKIIVEVIQNLNSPENIKYFKNAKKWLIGNWIIGFDSSRSISRSLATWQNMGFDVNRINTRNSKINAITDKQIEDTIAKYLDTKSMIMVIVK